uniref:Uncharacterized protein n=1 Tax=Peronospora matthiolae TaxID=2874970 RepID=A0AAV1TX23_9STRA
MVRPVTGFALAFESPELRADRMDLRAASEKIRQKLRPCLSRGPSSTKQEHLS